MPPPMTILAINGIILVVAYFLLFPRLVGDNLQKMALNDLLASIVALIVAGSLYMGSGLEFRVFGVPLNWFWFTLLSYLALEFPLAIWYLKKNGMRLS
ncbi:hypothetical protein [Pseudohongiella spirulinae]|uniref:Uncharacterized protein n=1 Tax=Pseudohongiella spirulinae TaxID=1249552 RepID=A0A0S2KHD7_9GAMM|nr:hypothetical protein [Pseudohongiella spirulinae]ALO47518.1 hypothetical protein PS2015_2890 [Pseudohongiella spirulinae]